jgi:hypothetical protein
LMTDLIGVGLGAAALPFSVC